MYEVFGKFVEGLEMVGGGVESGEVVIIGWIEVVGWVWVVRLWVRWDGG